ncbi:hypothetical protein KFK09_025028 [Dendrobium nobile]|uniref:Uncharacterized protein n=1 Tax=Dendrobium nobile TaxID=94219 RepID=A0A8T3AGJ1_DENNO|nr:hypothetical protein KFK09_025015 [Dendrobium nobile]KAI0494882.1 hypothetical protein KFK09_025028 [Dendrobium nobile]
MSLTGSAYPTLGYPRFVAKASISACMVHSVLILEKIWTAMRELLVSSTDPYSIVFNASIPYFIGVRLSAPSRARKFYGFQVG